VQNYSVLHHSEQNYGEAKYVTTKSVSGGYKAAALLKAGYPADGGAWAVWVWGLGVPRISGYSLAQESQSNLWPRQPSTH